VESIKPSFQCTEMVVVSPFSNADVEAAYSIFKQERINPWSLETFEKSALNGISLVAKFNDAIVGYILLSSVLDETTIEDITVDSTERRKGIARILIASSFDNARAAGQEHVFLEVRESNASAIHLYRSSGFELIGERKNYYETELDRQHPEIVSNKSSPRENALIMKKVLSPLSAN
jgi:ribosomal-protein-alanine N-acetyltransferase